MSKKILVLAVGLVLVFAGLAQAGIEGTAHDPNVAGFTNLAAGGKCSACHIPHGAQGNRLWPTTIGGAVYKGDVAVLCGYCHYSAGGAALGQAQSDAFVYGANSHGQFMTSGTTPLGQVSNTLPYANTTIGTIECTSCHNVHDDTNRPFLRSDINTMCAICHSERQYAAGVEKSGSAIIGSAAYAFGVSATYMGANNPGAHPVGTDITGDDGADSPITIPNWFDEEVNATAQQWTLGGHTSNGNNGGVVCVTCHDVHGLQEDAQDGTTLGVASVTPNPNFLVAAQGTVTLGRDVANGNNDPRNYLCEACHQGTAPATNFNASNVAWNDGDSTAVKYSNPGATSYGHPVDDMYSISGTSWVAAFPANWPQGSAAGASIPDPSPICESCHAPHAYADRTRADLTAAAIATTGDTDYILRGVRATVCNQCHSTGANNNTAHHPVGLTFQNDGVLYLTGTGGTAGQETLNCSTCHSGGGAHNWPTYSALGLDPNWIPLDNDRNNQFSTSTSTTCIDCHYKLDGDDANDSPTKHDGVLANYAGTDTGYAIIGIGTHFLGDTDSATWGALNPAFAVTNTDWSGNGGVAGGVSRFGNTAAAPVIVCESCHELQPSRNLGADTHLLLSAFWDGNNGTSGGTAGRDDLCEGCHLPTGTHPQTGDTVSRTNAALSTATAGVDWLKTPTDAAYGATWVDTNLTMAGNNVSCDSCHQVHDANSNGYTYILDADNAKVTSGSTVSLTGVTGYADSLFPVRHVNSNAQVGDFCGSCHPYR